MKELTIARGVFVCVAAAFLAMGSARAQGTDVPATSGEVPTADSTIGTGAGSVPTSKIAAEFQNFLGADSESVVRGLRNGESFTLTESTPGETPGQPGPGETPGQPGPTSDVTIDPPTGKMGYGNVRHTLELAQFQLQKAGIDQPTASQLDAALNGGSVTNSEGTVTDIQGVLTLRSEGMGWGRIAQEYGAKLGSVKNGRASLTAPTAAETAAETGAETGAEAGVVTGAGAPSGPGRGHGIVDATGSSSVSKGQGRGHGIVDATGASSGSNAQGRGHGIVDATGASSGSSGQGRGHGIVSGMGASSNGRGGSHVTTGLGSSSGSSAQGRGHGIVTGTGASSQGRGGSHVTTGLGSSSGSKSHGNAGGNGRGHGRGK